MSVRASSARPAAPGRLRRAARGAAPRLLPLVPFVALAVAWVVGWQLAHPNLATLPSVGQVWETVTRLSGNGELWSDIGASLGRWALGFAVGVLSGVVLGVLAGLTPLVSRVLEPLATFFTAMSGIVWLPLAIVWFGLGTVTVTFVIWNSVFFLVFANTLLGVRSVERVLEDAVCTLGASRLHVVTRVIVPGAMPHILGGVRAASGFGWRALIAAEIIGATTGLGAMIYQAKEFFRSDVIVTGILLIAIIGLAIDMLVLAPIERRTVERWGLVTVARRR